MNALMLGNMISFGASLFLAAGCCAQTKRKAYGFQCAESAVLCCAYLVFGAWAGLSTQVLSVVRNLMVLRDRFTVRWMILFTVLVVILGLAVNDQGLVGLIPVAATVQLTLCNHFCRTILQVKVSFLVNALQWMVFSFRIGDLVNGCTQIVIVLLCVVSLLRLTRHNRTALASAKAGGNC